MAAELRPNPGPPGAPGFVQANTNGRLHPADEPSIAPLNRGYLYGDAIYEVWRTYGGVIFAWREHLERLSASGRALDIECPIAPDPLLEQIRRTTAEFRGRTGCSGDLYIRLQVTRGGGAIGLDTALADRSDFVLLVQPCPSLAPRQAGAGLALSIARDLRRNPAGSLNPAWKTGNYLNNLLCLREARARGADEVVILNPLGEITEAAVSNLAFVRRGEVLTPPMSSGILGGITRGLLLGRVAAEAGIPVREERILPSDLPSMDECMLLSTTKDVSPVAKVDDLSFQVGPATVTTRLKTAFAEVVRQYAAAHPELAV